MAAALHPPRNEAGGILHANLYPRALMNELDFQDHRYPTVASHSSNPQRSSAMMLGASDRFAWEESSNANNISPPRRSFDPSGPSSLSPTWSPDAQRNQPEHQQLQSLPLRGAISTDLQSLKSQSQLSSQQSQEPQRSTLSYALPPGAARRVVERYSLDDPNQRTPSRGSAESRPTAIDSTPDLASRSRSGTPQAARQLTPQERPIAQLHTTPRHPSLPTSGMAAGPSFSPPIMPLSASPSYNPPIAPKHRTYPQQPTYITPPKAPNPINTVYSPNPPPPQEEVCVECAMRDQDMADVDVTSPGVWERESDATYEDLKQREKDDEAKGVPFDDSSRPRATGGRLTEQNLKIWLSVNPKEPASRQQTLNTYIKAQRTLLEAEALAHARAMQEAKQLDNRMRDAYSQLRRSAYDMGSSAAPADDSGGVRIKPPSSPTSPSPQAMHANARTRTHSREVTLLENGMIVEHVDVRKEEREARERRRKEERRARKSSRSSGIDVTSLISAQSYAAPATDSGLGLKPYSRYSQASSARPTSVLTAPLDRPDLPRAYSQASFSDVHSMGSGSPRRTRFFGFKNLSAGWRSQDSLAPSGMSGSMVDMHVALQREAHGNPYPNSPVDLNTPRRSQIWPPPDIDLPPEVQEPAPEDKPKKKKKGLAKIWRIVTGSSKNDPMSNSREPSRSYDRNEDDLPLAPPPPLSYLVDRGPPELLNGRGHASTPSLPSTTSPRIGLYSPGMSPPTAPSSILPSPASSRPPGPDLDMIEVRQNSGNYEDVQEGLPYSDEASGKAQTVGSRNVQPMTSEPDIRQRASQVLPNSPLPNMATLALPQGQSPRPVSVMAREKSLPPLPGEPRPRTLTTVADTRPRTVYTYDPRQLPPGSGPAHDFLPPKASFRAPDARRQSFSGLSSSRPNVAAQTMPVGAKLNGNDRRRPIAPGYNEFGASRQSLAGMPSGQERIPPRSPPTPSGKRKSNFGFSSLFGKKHQHDSEAQENGNHLFPPMRRSGSGGQDDMTTSAYHTSGSRHSAFVGAPGTRMSVTRKPLEELVAQDADFVAYRYPSNDQRLDLLR